MTSGQPQSLLRPFGLLKPSTSGDPKQMRDAILFHGIVPLAFGAILGSNQTGIAFYLPWVLSISYWVVLSLITWQILHLVTTGVAIFTRALNLPLTAMLIVGALLTTFLMRPFMYEYSGLFADYLQKGRTVQPMPPFQWDVEFILRHLQLWTGMIVVWVAINVIFDRFVGAPRYRAAHIAPRQLTTPPGATLPAGTTAVVHDVVSQFGLPPGTEILALKSEDHYLRVFSNHGEKLILMRMSDAIKDLAGAHGARVHRSYWVAKQAIERTDAQGRNVVLHLKNGLQVPISQTYKESARLAGLVA